MGNTTNLKPDDSEDTCVICLSSVTERAITVPCNHHNFDFVCLVSWLQERSTCPLCNTEVSAVQYDWQSPTDFKCYAVPKGHPPGIALSRNTVRPSSFLAPDRLPRTSWGTRRPYSPPVENTALRRRREVYRRHIYSLHVGSNSFSGYRDIAPEMIANSPELQSRARAWIRRELRVFTFLHADPAGSGPHEVTVSSRGEFLLSYIVSILKMVDIKASNGHAENLLTELLGRDNSRLFLHELNAWLRSPYVKVEEWDLNVQYADDLE